MPLGDIVKTLNYEVTYSPKGTGTLVAGHLANAEDVASGNWIPATASTLGTHGMVTGLIEVRDGIDYYQVLITGYGRCEMGGVVNPNQPIVSDATGKVIAGSTTVTTPTQAEVQEIWRVSGRYIRLDTDNQYAPSVSADTNIGIVRIGGLQL